MTSKLPQRSVKVCGYLPFDVYTKFKDVSSKKFNWEREYTNRAVVYAIMTWLYVEDVHNNIEKVLAISQARYPDIKDKKELEKKVMNDLINAYMEKYSYLLE